MLKNITFAVKNRKEGKHMERFTFELTYLNIDTNEERYLQIEVKEDDFFTAWKIAIDNAAIDADEYEELQGIKLISIINERLWNR